MKWRPLKRREGFYKQINQANCKDIIELAFYRLTDSDGFQTILK